MKVEIEELTPIKRTIKVEIPSDVVSKAFAQAYASLRKKVKVPGFRPGKVPLSLLERRYAKEVEEEIVQKLIPDYYRKAVEEFKLDPVEFPAIEQVSVKKDAPLSFMARVEVRPKIEPKNYTGIELAREAMIVGEPEVEKALEHLREQHGQLEIHSPERMIQQGDYAAIDIEGYLGETPLSDQKAQGLLLEVGSKTLSPEIEDALMGKKKGDAFEAPITFPEDDPDVKLAGKTLTYRIAVQEVKRKVLPDPDDDFAKDLGLESLGKLREKLHAQLQDRWHSERTAQEKEQIVKHLIAQHQFDLPSSLVEREMREILSRWQNQQQATGRGSASVDSQALEKEFRSLAEERVQGRLLLQSIAVQEGLTVEDQEVEQDLSVLAKGVQATTQELKRWILSKEGSLEGIRMKLLERKALEFLHSKAVFSQK